MELDRWECCWTFPIHRRRGYNRAVAGDQRHRRRCDLGDSPDLSESYEGRVMASFTNNFVSHASQIDSFYTNIIGFGGDGSNGAYAPASSANATGERNFTTVNIASGVTIDTGGTNATRCTQWSVQGDCLIAGAIVTNKIAAASGSATAGANGEAGLGYTGPTGGGAGSATIGGGGGGSYVHGGDGGGANNNGVRLSFGNITGGTPTLKGCTLGVLPWCGAGGGGASVDGGQGAQGFALDVAGNLTVTGSITANGTDGSAGTTQPGGGGGGAGPIYIRVKGNADFSGATITANGGAGGAGGSSDGDGGGGGGGGLIVLCIGGTYTAPATLTASAGAGGAKGAGAGTAGQDGNAGSIYRISF